MCWHYTYHHFTLCDHIHPIPTHKPYYIPPQHCQQVTDALNWYHTQPERLPEIFPVPMPRPCPMEPPEWDWVKGEWALKNCRIVGVSGLCMFCAEGRGWGGLYRIVARERGGYQESYTDENGEGRVRWYPLEEGAEDLGEVGNRMMGNLRRMCARMGIRNEETPSANASQFDRQNNRDEPDPSSSSQTAGKRAPPTDLELISGKDLSGTSMGVIIVMTSPWTEETAKLDPELRGVKADAERRIQDETV